MNENQNYENMLKLNTLTNSLSPEQQLQQEQKRKLMDDYLQQMNMNKILDPMANMVDFMSNTYRGGKVGGAGTSVSQLTQSPGMKQQGAMLGWMGKDNPSAAISPLQLAKFKYQQEKDLLKGKEKTINDQFKLEQRKSDIKMKILSRPDVTKLAEASSQTESILRALESDDFISKALAQRGLLKAMGEGSRMSDYDIKNVSGDPSVDAWLDRFYNKYAAGKISTKDQAVFRRLALNLSSSTINKYKAILKRYHPASGIEKSEYDEFVRDSTDPLISLIPNKNKKKKKSQSVRTFVRNEQGKLVEVE